MVLKGVAGDYDWDFLKQHLLEGEIPVFSDTASTNKVLVSRSIADKLHLKMDDKLYTYYIEGENVRARLFPLPEFTRPIFLHTMICS